MALNVVTVANRLQNRSFSELQSFAQFIHDSINTNAGTFSSPPVSMPAFQSAINNYKDANAAWGVTGNRGPTTARDARDIAYEILIAMITQLGTYVQLTARSSGSTFAGQLAIVNMAGMRAKAAGSVIGVFNRPQNVRQVLLDSLQFTGKIHIDWLKPIMPNAAAKPAGYKIYSSVDGNDPWVEVGFSTTTSFTTNAYSIGRKLSFRVTALAAAGESGASDPCTGVGQ